MKNRKNKKKNKKNKNEKNKNQERKGVRRLRDNLVIFNFNTSDQSGILRLNVNNLKTVGP